MVIATLSLGIVGICITLFSAGSLGIVGMLCGLAGIVCYVLAIRKPVRKKKLATAGLILSVIAAGLGLVLFKACTSLAASGAMNRV